MRVKIRQVLEGYVDIDAATAEKAIRKAHDMYFDRGEELPDMDDGLPLEFSVEE